MYIHLYIRCSHTLAQPSAHKETYELGTVQTCVEIW